MNKLRSYPTWQADTDKGTGGDSASAEIYNFRWRLCIYDLLVISHTELHSHTLMPTHTFGQKKKLHKMELF
ncbi:hypothetical protein [Pontibacter mangrovi]|uniref:Uncharacterized protein n=1 Tax=Pontibacter mangrovi TaxID=2589816 RepID=A0A501W6H2_9BACT|nr:hypothetical protein [Pontibacter mangrovi]TPE44888.1 hypothetical protein FJM65_07665 [Pontibacter mangrovi]